MRGPVLITPEGRVIRVPPPSRGSRDSRSSSLRERGAATVGGCWLVAIFMGSSITAWSAPSNAVAPETVVLVPAPRAPKELESFQPRPARTTFEAQLVLARRAISPGSLDGVMGPQTRAALRAFQAIEHLATNGLLDGATKARLLLTAPPLTTYQIASNDLARLTPVGSTWLAKSQQERLEYANLLELVAERAWSHPKLLRNLNTNVDWAHPTVGMIVTIPNVQFPSANGEAASIRISLSERLLTAFDASTNLLAHFPCSIARLVENRPLGQLSVLLIAADPTYRFDPAMFPDSIEGRELGRPLTIPPGPNNPVGNAWIGLDRPGYGIHGTPEPENVGRTESRGCFRLSNWNALYLARLVRPGTTVIVEP